MGWGLSERNAPPFFLRVSIGQRGFAGVAKPPRVLRIKLRAMRSEVEKFASYGSIIKERPPGEPERPLLGTGNLSCGFFCD